MLKKETKRKILSIFLPPIASFLLKFIYMTCKVRFHGDIDSEKYKNIIYTTWHGELILAPFAYMKLHCKKSKVCVLTSQHFDGRLIGKVFNRISGGTTVEGSSFKGGARALINTLRILKEENVDLAIAPDGPRGPRHSVAQGIVVLSQRLNIPIVAVNCRASSLWRFKSWDKMFLPKPFSKIDIFVSDIFFLSGLSLNEAQNKVKEKLMENADE